VGTKNQTTTTQQTPNPTAGAAYNSLLQRASGVADTPYQSYSGELVAPVNAQQNLGIGNINQGAGFAQPYIQQAAQYATNAAQPLTAEDIERYSDPYTQQVINATEGQFAHDNAVQQQGVLGNAAAQGALGGNRVGVAQALTAEGQQRAQAPVIAGLRSQGYNTGLNTAMNQQQQQAQAAYSLGNLGVAGQNAYLTGANAQIGAGTLQQGTQQALNAANYGQFTQAQAFPYQQAQWLAGIDTGVGSQMGGTSQTTKPGPNLFSQIAGLGMAGVGAFTGNPGAVTGGLNTLFGGGNSAGNYGGSPATNPNLNPASFGNLQNPYSNPYVARGGRIEGFDSGGAVVPYGGVGMPYAGAGPSWMPQAQITHGRGLPGVAGGDDTPSSPGVAKIMSDATMLARKFMSQPGGEGARYGGVVAPPSDGSIMVPRGYDDGGGVPLPRPDPRGPPIMIGGVDQRPSSGAPEYGASDHLKAALRAVFEGGKYRESATSRGERDDSGLYDRRRGYEDGGTPTMAGFGSGSMVPQDFNLFDPNPTPAYANGFPPEDRPPSQWDSGKLREVPFDPASFAPGTFGMATPDDQPPDPYIGGRDEAYRAAMAAAGDDPYGAIEARAGVGDSSQEAPAAGVGNTGGWSSGIGPALMSAGFGMMASQSPFIGTAIGEGGLAGLKTYTEGQQREVANRRAEATMARQAEQTNIQQKSLGLRVNELKQRALQAQEALKAQTQRQQEALKSQKERQQEAIKAQQERHDADLAERERLHSNPIKIGENPRTGAAIMGVRDPKNPNQFLDPITREPIDAGTMTGVQPSRPSGTPTAPPAAEPVKPAPLEVKVPESRVKTAFGDEEDAASALRGVLNSGGTPEGVNPDVLDDPMLSEGDRNKVKAIGEGRAAFLPISRGNKENQFIMKKAYEYNPNLDQTMFPRRQRTENFYSVGTQGGGGQQVIALNRFAAHTGSLLKLAESLDESRFPTWNAFRNFASRQGVGVLFGDKKEMQDVLGAWDVNAKGVGDEAAKVFAGSNPALADRTVWEKVLKPETPLSTIKAKLRQAVEMSEGALQALAAGYNEGTRSNHQPREFLTPHTQEIFEAVKANRPIGDVVKPSGGATATDKPKTVIQNGHKYELQPDGSYR
jgi:hypothetical protein